MYLRMFVCSYPGMCDRTCVMDVWRERQGERVMRSMPETSGKQSLLSVKALLPVRSNAHYPLCQPLCSFHSQQEKKNITQVFTTVSAGIKLNFATASDLQT